MKVLITGGGTGGHIYPAIAIANKIKDEIKNIDILYVGSKKGMEGQLVPDAGYKFESIRVSGFKRSLSMDTFRSCIELCLGLKDAVRIIKSYKPDLIIGTGGFVCGPLVFIGSLFNIKTVIHEQNVIPGVTNKILSKFVDKVLISFEESKVYFNKSSKIAVTGNPVRKDFMQSNKKKCREELGIDKDKLAVLAFGGSRGAEKINEAMMGVMTYFNGSSEIQIIHVTGEVHYNKIISNLQDKTNNLSSNIEVKPYIHDMAKYMCACDLVISRSGAITLAEITAIGLPSILIPSPNVTNNHQEYNAKVLEKNGSAILLTEANLNDKNIVNLLNKFLKNREQLRIMGEKSKGISKPNAIESIYCNIIQLIDTM